MSEYQSEIQYLNKDICNKSIASLLGYAINNYSLLLHMWQQREKKLVEQLTNVARPVDVARHDAHLALSRLRERERATDKLTSRQRLEREMRLTRMTPGQLGPINLVLFCLTNLCFTCTTTAEQNNHHDK